MVETPRLPAESHAAGARDAAHASHRGPASTPHTTARPSSEPALAGLSNVVSRATFGGRPPDTGGIV
jgi:hypothetical protein